MMSRFAAGIVAGLFALAATPAIAQVKGRTKAGSGRGDQESGGGDRQAPGNGGGTPGQVEATPNGAGPREQFERVEKSQVELKLEDVTKRARVEKNGLRRSSTARSSSEGRTQAGGDRIRPGDEGRREPGKAREGGRQGPGGATNRPNSLRSNGRSQSSPGSETSRSSTNESGGARADYSGDRSAHRGKVRDRTNPRSWCSIGRQGAGPYEKMSPQELKQLITKLQILLEEKIRNAEKPGTEKVKPYPASPASARR